MCKSMQNHLQRVLEFMLRFLHYRTGSLVLEHVGLDLFVCDSEIQKFIAKFITHKPCSPIPFVSDKGENQGQRS